MPGTALVHRLPFFVLLFCFHDVSVLSLFIVFIVECAARMSMRWRREMQCTTVHGLIVQIARICSILFHCENASCSEDERSFMLRERWT